MAVHNNLTNLRDPSVLKSPLPEGDEPPQWAWGWFKRMDSAPPTVHCLPADGGYESKHMANGKPLFVRVANEAGDPLTGKGAAEPEPPHLDHSVDTVHRRSSGRGRAKE